MYSCSSSGMEEVSDIVVHAVTWRIGLLLVSLTAKEIQCGYWTIKGP